MENQNSKYAFAVVTLALLVFTAPNVRETFVNGMSGVSDSQSAAVASVCPPGYTCVYPSSAKITSVIAKPLALSYDSSHKEAALVAQYQVSVNGGVAGAGIYKVGSGVKFMNNISNWSITYPATLSPIYFASSSSMIKSGTDDNGQVFFLVPANTVVTFTATVIANPSIMFPGPYSAALLYVSTNPNYTTNNVTYLPTPPNLSNNIIIIGETAPYLTAITTPSIDPSQKALYLAGQKLAVQGQRLQNSYLMIDGVKQTGTSVSVSSQGTIANFALPKTIVVGWHTLVLQNTKGASNNLGFQTGTSTLGQNSAVAVNNISVLFGNKTVTNAGTTTQTFSMTANLTAGNSPIYVAKDINVALSTTTAPAGMSIADVDWSDTNTNGDGATFFYIAPGQTKTFTASFFASANPEVSGIFQVTSVNAGTSSSTMTSINLNSSDVTNALKVTLFH